MHPAHMPILLNNRHVEAPARQPPCQADTTHACSHNDNFLPSLLVVAGNLPCPLLAVPVLTGCAYCLL